MATVELVVFTFLFAGVLATISALVVTYRRRPWVDRIFNAVSFLGIGTPPFWLGLLLLLVFFQVLGLLPGPEGRLSQSMAAPPDRTGLLLVDSLLAGRVDAFGSAFVHLLLPAVALGFAVYATILRILRANLLEVANEPFITVVQAKGITRWTAFARHALPNASLPALTAAGLVFAQLLAGSVLVEAIFNWPGLGSLIVEAIANKDFTVVQTFILLSVTMYVVVNIVVDLVSSWIDPRVSLRAERSEA